MKVAFITGASRGIGLATALHLSKIGYQVYGLSRGKADVHFEQISIDLSKPNSLQNFTFPSVEGADELVLINNAGSINPIKKIGKHYAQDLIQFCQINLAAPMVLCNQFIKQFSSAKAKKVIINISSGAAFRAISGWTPYCSTKAGLEMLGLGILEEQSDFRVVNLSPGVVDTQTQGEIRQADASQFEMLDRFKELKKQGQLKSPEQVAKEIEHCIKSTDISGTYRHSD